ncbi:hypothetical protein [Marinimicrobium agarilyticum]|uniref:hypothetical protein n=1 Tax=Marinimicrobium agarilyticum TaxID=306546 RepID=UPI000487AE39|nr:hypothetical protein [Marinimicrobium agarilyticum]
MKNRICNVYAWLICLSGVYFASGAGIAMADDGGVLPTLNYFPEAYQPQKKMTFHRKKQYVKEMRRYIDALEGCEVALKPIEDKRQNTITVGVHRGRSIRVSGVGSWLEDVYSHELTKPIYEPELASPDFTLEPSLTRLYTYEAGGGYEAVSALNVTIIDNQRVVETLHYRGFAARLPVFGREETQLNSLSQSMWQSLKNLELDLDRLCDRYSG